MNQILSNFKLIIIMALYYNNKRVLLTDTRKKHHYSFGARTDYNSYKILCPQKLLKKEM